MGLRIWHDDVRPAPMGWVWVQNNHDARIVLKWCIAQIDEISMDHDLGAVPHGEAGIMARGWDEDNGLKLVEWMVTHDCVPPAITIHSWNPEGAQRMRRAFADHGYTAFVVPFDPHEYGRV